MLKKVLQFLFALALLGAPSFAQAKETQPELRALSRFMFMRAEFEAPDTRVSFIKALQAYCLALDKAFPKNSPSEQAWLDNEIDSGDSNRMIRAYGTSEWSRAMVENYTSTCQAFTQSYLSEPDKRIVALFALIEATSRISDSAALHARRNGLDADRWGFLVLDDSVTALSMAGIWESGRAFSVAAE